MKVSYPPFMSSDGSIGSDGALNSVWLQPTLVNGFFEFSVSGNALTIAIKNVTTGLDPSSSNPVTIIFRHATISSGRFSFIRLTSATSFTIDSGSTLGATNATPFRIWLVGFNDSDTFRLGVINCWGSNFAIYPLRENYLASSTAQSSGNADSLQTIYTASAVSGKPLAILGYFEYDNLTTAGTWNATPDRVVLYRPGIPLPSEQVNVINYSTGEMATGSTTMPNDDTIPQITEGSEFFSLTYTPFSIQNNLVINSMLNLACSASGLTVSMALFTQISDPNALAAGSKYFDTNNVRYQIALHHTMLAKSSSLTFTVRAGPATAGTLTLNGQSSARRLGGVLNSFLSIAEIMS